MKDVEIPEWKKKALAAGNNDAQAAPFGMTNWSNEASVSATADSASNKQEHHHEHHSHSHSHSHDHGHS